MSEKKNCIPAENCTGYYQAIAYDLDCIQKHPTVCQVLRCLLLNCFSNKQVQKLVLSDALAVQSQGL